MSLKILVNNLEAWNAFEKELDERIQNSYRMFSQTEESNVMYRMQGQVHALNALKQLRLKVNADG
jgi:hypothetical protein|tara:strand:+ start:1765 stop:1959 length:195 start_codon:yes stop_codon:yes gene_type:complete